MSTLTRADHDKKVACQCRTTRNWLVGTVNVRQGVIRILVRGVIRPLNAFLEIARVSIDIVGELTTLRGERLKAIFCVTDDDCRFITEIGHLLRLQHYERFVTASS